MQDLFKRSSITPTNWRNDSRTRNPQKATNDPSRNIFSNTPLWHVLAAKARSSMQW